jgi:hypothetical protein
VAGASAAVGIRVLPSGQLLDCSPGFEEPSGWVSCAAQASFSVCVRAFVRIGVCKIVALVLTLMIGSILTAGKLACPRKSAILYLIRKFAFAEEVSDTNSTWRCSCPASSTVPPTMVCSARYSDSDNYCCLSFQTVRCVLYLCPDGYVFCRLKQASPHSPFCIGLSAPAPQR